MKRKWYWKATKWQRCWRVWRAPDRLSELCAVLGEPLNRTQDIQVDLSPYRALVTTKKIVTRFD